MTTTESNLPKLKFYKLRPAASVPRMATEGSACFDFVFPGHNGEYDGYDKLNRPFRRFEPGKIVLMPGDRIIIRLGLIADIPENHSLRIHPRSGLSIREGLVLANQEAVIDSDYVEEICVLLMNISEQKITIFPGDRIAQGELVKTLDYQITETKKKPSTKTSRKGGMGSTGK